MANESVYKGTSAAIHAGAGSSVGYCSVGDPAPAFEFAVSSAQVALFWIESSYQSSPQVEVVSGSVPMFSYTRVDYPSESTTCQGLLAGSGTYKITPYSGTFRSLTVVVCALGVVP